MAPHCWTDGAKQEAHASPAVESDRSYHWVCHSCIIPLSWTLTIFSLGRGPSVGELLGRCWSATIMSLSDGPRGTAWMMALCKSFLEEEVGRAVGLPCARQDPTPRLPSRLIQRHSDDGPLASRSRCVINNNALHVIVTALCM